MRHLGNWSLLVLTLSFGVNAMDGPPVVSQPESSGGDGSAAKYESYALRYKSGVAKMETRVGDYATTIEKGVRKGSGSDDTFKTQLSFTTSITGGGAATTTVQRETSVTADYSRVCSSISEEIVDTLLEDATGASICRDKPAFTRVHTVIRATIRVTNVPEAEWVLEAVALPVVDDFGSRSIWGRGVLTSGDRSLQLTYRSDSPWAEEQCLQMRQAQDERKWDCYRKVVEIGDDGGLVAWYASNEETCTFRSGLDDDSKLVVLAAIEAFRKGNSREQSYY